MIVKRETKKGHYVIIKGSVKQEYITMVNMQTRNTGALYYIKQVLTDIKEEIDSNKIIVENFKI